MSKVIVTDSDASGAEGEAVALAEGVLIGATAAVAEQAHEDAQEAQAEAEVAAVAAVSLEAQVADIKAALIGLYDMTREDIAALAEAIALLADETEDVAEAEMAQALDTAALTEIVTDEPEATAEAPEAEAETAHDEQSDETAAAANEPENAPESQSIGRRQRAGTGRIGFRRGRR